MVLMVLVKQQVLVNLHIILKILVKSVLIAAGDTFRAAAIEQLQVWADRVDVKMVKHNQGADSSAVIFDAIKSFKAKSYDVLNLRYGRKIT